MDQIFQPARWLDWVRDRVKSLFESRVERRKTPRKEVLNLTANYWEGLGLAYHRVRDVSLGGAFILADFKWVPGTIVTMTLQFEDQLGGSGSPITTVVRARVVRQATEGLGVQFFDLAKRERQGLAKFLQSIPDAPMRLDAY